MEAIVKLNEECEWSWEDWHTTYLKEVFAHANIQAVEIYADDVDDYEQINLYVKEINTTRGNCIGTKYALRFFEDYAIQGCAMLAHFLWKVNGCDMELVDQAIYQIFKKDNGSYNCLVIAEEP